MDCKVSASVPVTMASAATSEAVAAREGEALPVCDMLDADPVWASEVDKIEPGRVDELGGSHADLNRALHAVGLWERFDCGVEARAGRDDDARVRRVEHKVPSREKDLSRRGDDCRGRHGCNGLDEQTGRSGSGSLLAGESGDAGVIKVRVDALARYSAPVCGLARSAGHWRGSESGNKTRRTALWSDCHHALRRALRASCHSSCHSPPLACPGRAGVLPRPSAIVRLDRTRRRRRHLLFWIYIQGTGAAEPLYGIIAGRGRCTTLPVVSLTACAHVQGSPAPGCTYIQHAPDAAMRREKIRRSRGRMTALG